LRPDAGSIRRSPRRVTACFPRPGPGVSGLPERWRRSGFVMRPRPLRVFGPRSRRKPELAGRASFNAVADVDFRYRSLPWGRRIRFVSEAGGALRDQPLSPHVGLQPLSRFPATDGPKSYGLHQRFSRHRRYGWLSPPGRSILHPSRCKPVRMVRLSPNGLHFCIPSGSTSSKDGFRSPLTRVLRPTTLSGRPYRRTRRDWELSLPFATDRLEPPERRTAPRVGPALH